jgi:hypothetical protein
MVKVMMAVVTLCSAAGLLDEAAPLLQTVKSTPLRSELGEVKGQVMEIQTHDMEHLGEFDEDRDMDPELIAEFDEMDKNGDGLIDRKEMKARMDMKDEPAIDQATDEGFKIADTDGDGKISKKEFLVAELASHNPSKSVDLLVTQDVSELINDDTELEAEMEKSKTAKACGDGDGRRRRCSRRRRCWWQRGCPLTR